MRRSNRFYSILDVISALRKAGRIGTRKSAYLLFLAQNGAAAAAAAEIRPMYGIKFDASGDGYYFIIPAAVK